MAKAIVKNLISQIQKLHNERQSHVDAIEEIDAIFADIGIQSTAVSKSKLGRPKKKAGKVSRPRKASAKRGRPAKKKVAKKKRGKSTGKRYKVSGPQMLLDKINKAGAKGASSSVLVAQWKKEGRSGSPYNVLNKLVKERHVKKTSKKGERASVYIGK